MSKLMAFASDFDNVIKADVFLKTAIIKHLPTGEWGVFSQKGKSLGKYKTKAEAVKRLRQVEYFKHHKEASKDDSYSSIMRDLNKHYDEETTHKFQQTFKDTFDQALLNGDEAPENKALEEAMKCISLRDDIKAFKKVGTALNLGDPNTAGKYLADLLRFLLQRIKPERRAKAAETLRKKVYFINEFDVASKKTPPTAAFGQSILLLKHILIEHSPQYIRGVLNSVVKHL
jgi:hypothetical protein